MTSQYFAKLLGIELSVVSLKEKCLATLGGGLAILVLCRVAFWALPGPAAACIITSMGASAVLLYAVPHGPLSQPWPVLGGHGISAIIGVTCARYLPHPEWAAAAAVGLAIGAMHQLKCIHPPGGATAFAAVMGGQAIADLGYWFVLYPVMVNAVAMVLLAILFNSLFHWRRYPAILSRPAASPAKNGPASAAPPTHEEVRQALKSLDSFVDISEEDLLRLTELLHRRAGPGATPPGR